MVVNGRPLKRMKSRVSADPLDFLRFPCRSGGPGGPFRTRVRWFLSNHGLLPPPSSLFPQLLTWQLLFRVGDLSLPCLDVIEEDVSRSRSLYCDQCRVVGWSGHPVCGKRYHFIIKADGKSIGGYHKPCTCCGDLLLLSESRCKTCDHTTTTDGLEDWVYNQLENTTHLLHGVVHSNGYGHLLRVNGREGGSTVLSGCHIMDFWDQLCKALGVRKVSVMDVSKKYGLEYRLLHAITRGHTWYGDWGYEFGAGSFAVTRDAYLMAVRNLSNLPLSMLFSQGWISNTHLLDVISFYQSLSESGLVNIRDLFSFLMSLIHDIHNSISKVNDSSGKKHPPCGSGYKCSWTIHDIRRVEEAMFRVLRAVTGSNWVSWRTLRGAVYKVAPPDLLDYCLKELGGKSAADGMVVSSRHNPDSGAFEYRLEQESSTTVCCPSEGKLLQDLRYLYENLLHPQTMWRDGPQEMREHVINSAKKLLDCKQFMKDYKPMKMMPSNRSPVDLSLCCEVELVDLPEEYATNPPSEIIVVSPNATISDLKLATSRAFQDVYLMFRKFQVEEVVGYGSVDDSAPLKLLLQSTELVRARGRCLGKNVVSRYRMERGTERWTVDCWCGAKDDDGERMLACDACSVWQHTRCCGIDDLDSVPARYVCHRCSTMKKSSKDGRGSCCNENNTASGSSSSLLDVGKRM